MIRVLGYEGGYSVKTTILIPRDSKKITEHLTFSLTIFMENKYFKWKHIIMDDGHLLEYTKTMQKISFKSILVESIFKVLIPIFFFILHPIFY